MKRFAPACLICIILTACNMPQPITEAATEIPAPTESPMPDTPVPAEDTAPALPLVDQMLAECPTAEQIAAIDADLSISFESDPTASQGLACTAAEDSKDVTHFQRRIYNILRVMQELKFDQPLPWTDKQLFDWFTGAIDGIRFRNDIDYSACCDPAGIINIQTNNLVATSMDRWIEPAADNGLVHIMILFVHEARHNEGYGHTCADGNDSTLDEMGAWGVEYYTEIWLADHVAGDLFANSSFDYAESMRSEAQRILETRFCQ